MPRAKRRVLSKPQARVWGAKSSQYLLQNPYVSVRKDLVLRPDGRFLPYFVVERHDFAVIVPVLPNGDLVLVRQYRYPIGRYTWEFPMGIVSGVSMLKAAKTELIQETGYRARRWRKLGVYNVAAGMMNQRAHIYLAEGLVPGEPEPEDGEFLKSRHISFATFEKWILRGQFQDGPSLIAWQYYNKS